MALYRFSLSHNDSYAFREYPRITGNQRVHQELVPDFSGVMLASRRCKACGELLDKWSESPLTFRVNKRKLESGITYDGVAVVSGRFKSIFEDAGLFGIDFRQLPDDPSFFMIQAKRAVLFDAERRKTRFIKHCPLCGQFESVIGATPVYLRDGTEIEGKEVVRTDLEFGSGDEKHPVFICGDVAASSLLDANLTGLNIVII